MIVSKVDQIRIEAKILTAVCQHLSTKKDFYRKIGGQFQVNSSELDRILSEMEHRAILTRFQTDQGGWQYAINDAQTATGATAIQ